MVDKARWVLGSVGEDECIHRCTGLEWVLGQGRCWAECVKGAGRRGGDHSGQGQLGGAKTVEDRGNLACRARVGAVPRVQRGMCSVAAAIVETWTRPGGWCL